MCFTDNGPAGNRKTGTATVLVTVLDINDNKPIFLKSSYEATVPENIPESSSIVKVGVEVQQLVASMGLKWNEWWLYMYSTKCSHALYFYLYSRVRFTEVFFTQLKSS